MKISKNTVKGPARGKMERNTAHPKSNRESNDSFSDFCIRNFAWKWFHEILFVEKNQANHLRLVRNIPLFTGFHSSQVVQDFFHQQYETPQYGLLYHREKTHRSW